MATVYFVASSNALQVFRSHDAFDWTCLLVLRIPLKVVLPVLEYIRTKTTLLSAW